jgi:hypothetical protein
LKTTYDASADPAKFQAELKKLRAETKFEALIQLIKPTYVGRIDGLASLTNRILKVTQKYYDTNANRMRTHTIAETNQKMQTLLQEIDRRNPPTDLPNLEQTLFQGLHESIQRKVLSTLHQLPPAYLSENLARYNALVKAATLGEDKERAIARQIRSVTAAPQNRSYTRSQQQRPGSGPRTFLAHGEHNEEEQETQENIRATTRGGLKYVCPATFMTTHPEDETYLMACMIEASIEMVDILYDEEEKCDGFAGVTIAEQALRTASGTRSPIKCFGCNGLPQFEQNNKAFHLWKDCPNKAQHTVWANFQKNLSLFRQERDRRRAEKQKYYGPQDDERTPAARTLTTNAHWNEMGYPSRSVKEQIDVIASNGTAPSVRRTMLAALKAKLGKGKLAEVDEDDDEEEEEERTSAIARIGKKRRKDKSGKILLMYMQKDNKEESPASSVPRTMLAASKGKYPLQIAYKLPHIQFPIGDGQTTQDSAKLTGLLDTGGCCMMGKLEYFLELQNVCPQFFHELFELNDQRYENINIGGLKDGIWITHLARIWIPYDHEGKIMRIEIGLSSELPVDMLYGVSFMRDTKMNISMGDNTVTSAYFGDTYDVVWRSPSNSPIEHIQHEAVKAPRVFLATAEE